MTIGIMPITGVPLPLMSYGGSSVLVTFIAIGLLQSIHIQARVAAAGKSRALRFVKLARPLPSAGAGNTPAHRRRGHIFQRTE